VALGGGRTRVEDRIDPAVGFTALAGLGEPVGPERPLALVHAGDPARAEAAAVALAAAVRIGDSAPARGPAVVERLAAESA
jgi:thymidine phosphorylase